MIKHTIKLLQNGGYRKVSRKGFSFLLKIDRVVLFIIVLITNRSYGTKML
jgi:hypothetical protein